MSTASPTAAVIRTESRLFTRELGSVFWIVLFPTILVVILGSVPSMNEPDPNLGGQRLVDVYSSVAVLLSIIMASLMAMPAVIAGYREAGILRRLRTTPVHPGSLLLAQAGLHALAVLLSLVLVLVVGRVAYDVRLPQDIWWYAVVVLLATAAAFSIGAVITALAPSARLVQTIGTIVFFPTMFAAGVYFPVQAMQGWLHTVVVSTPMGAATEALNDAVVGRTPDLVDLAVMTGWTVVLSLVAVRSFRWD